MKRDRSRRWYIDISGSQKKKRPSTRHEIGSMPKYWIISDDVGNTIGDIEDYFVPIKTAFDELAKQKIRDGYTVTYQQRRRCFVAEKDGKKETFQIEHID